MLKRKLLWALPLSLVLGSVLGVSISHSRFAPLVFWGFTLAFAVLGFRAGSRGPLWRSLAYTCYGGAVTTVIFGFIIMN